MMERLTITIEALANGDPRPPIVRLRSLLKLMLRGFGLKCLAVVPNDEDVDKPDNLSIDKVEAADRMDEQR